MYKVLVITQDEFAIGFELVGLKTYRVSNSKEAMEKLMEQFDLKEYGILLIDEALAKDFDPKLKQKIFSCDLPLVIILPMRRELKERLPEDEFSEFILSAIGYKIRLQ